MDTNLDAVVDVPSEAKTAKHEPKKPVPTVSFDSCLAAWAEPETVSFHCPACNKTTSALKYVRITQIFD